MRVAMWSGPRNLSTALMYSFAQRADTTPVDEPFYAAYLAETGARHAMREEVLASQPMDPGEAASRLFCGLDTEHQYQKHMTQHLLPGFSRDWFDQVRHVFLIRHPARVLASWQVKHDSLTLTDIGFVQQLEIFHAVEGFSDTPIVVDAADIRAAPGPMLQKLCAALGLEWDPAMLQWPRGPKPYDGIWASHWYDAVHRSTGFAGPEEPLPELTDRERVICDEALPIYETLASVRLRL